MPLGAFAKTLSLAALLVAGASLGGSHGAAAQSLTGGGAYVGMAGATTALPGDAWGHANPAAWSTVERPTVALFASEAYGLSELRVGALHGTLPFGNNAASASVQTFGFEDYRETTFLVGGARAFSLGTSRLIHVGASVRTQTMRIPGFGSTAASGVSVGALVDVVPTLSFGVSALNVNGPEVAGEYAMDRTLRMGLAYQAAEQAVVTADLVETANFPASFRGGVQITPHRLIQLRVGVATEPTRFAGGVGITVGPLRADVAAEQHQELGWSPALSLQTSW
jgi:hypothetical protein